MKANIKYISASLLLAAVVMTGCRDEHLMTGGEGTLSLSATVNSDVEVISRALSAEEEDALAESAVIWISNSKGLVHEFVGAGNVPSSIRLVSGDYTAEAWVGDSVPASWDKTFYKSGFVPFEIVNGTNTEVKLACRVANTLASVRYTDATLEVLENPVMTIALEDGITDGSHSLTFDGVTADKGHFMINSRTKGLRWTLSGTQANGETFTKDGLIENIKPTTEYVLNVKYVSEEIAIGGAYFEIEVEEEPVGDDSEIQIVLPPAFTGLLGFDETGTVRGEMGNIGRKSVFISAAADLKYVEVESEAFASLGSVRLGLLNMNETLKARLAEAGVDWLYNYDADKDLATLRFNLEDEFVDALPEGDHTFIFTAEDVNGRMSTATFTISVTNAPVAPLPVDETTVDYRSAVLSASAIKDASEYGFVIRRAASGRSYEEWTRVAGTVTDGVVSVALTDLNPGTTYEYTAYADDYTSPEILTFKTKDYQLPNSGFEVWNTTAEKYYLICANKSEMFWDCGNQGSSTMSKNVTLPDESVKHSGSRSVKLASQFVGIGSLGKFAAGNVFIGQYLATDGTDGVLGWGRPWPMDFYPTALRVWVKYRPVAVTHDNAAYSELKKGDMDKGIIYVAMLDDTKTDYNGSEWPFVVKTKSSDRNLFDKNASQVIGYGEKVFEGNTPGEDMVEFIIPIEYKGDKSTIRNIMLVGSASKGGDYFTGGNGSNMWIDDIELIY